MMNAPTKLFDAFQLGPLTLSNRVVMAPLTRCRAVPPGLVPTPLAVEYYRQRASAGLIITEGSQISQQGQGFQDTPGIYSKDQVAGWRMITDAVHLRGGRIFIQLWHVGRISNISLQPGGGAPVAPSAIRPKARTFVKGTFTPTSAPRALELSELHRIVEQFRRGAANALRAGFDGVEIHGANGYLLDQFAKDGANKRNDAYGGPIESRTRLMLEVADAVVAEVGADRTGIRLSPLTPVVDGSDSNPQRLFDHIVEQLSALKLLYIHVIEGAAGGRRDISPFDYASLRRRFKQAYIANNGYDFERATQALATGTADLISFGKPFVSNPDLVERLKTGAPLSPWDEATLYGGGAKGYSDYPTSQAASDPCEAGLFVATKTSSAPATRAETVMRLHSDIQKLAPEIAARALEIEAAGTVPSDLVERLKAIGVFRMFVPDRDGGLELDLPAGLEIVRMLARIEGSVGWIVGIASGGALLTPFLPRDTYRVIYQGGPDTIIGGSGQPPGTAEAVPGGWRVNGRWAFVSACQHADWLAGFCLMHEAGKPMTNASGAALLRGFFLPARQWQIEHTWNALGLKGTGSHHVTLRDKVIPARNFFDPGHGASCFPGVLHLLLGAISVGIAEGALEDLVAYANANRQQAGAAVPMRESELFQFEIGRVAAELNAARALLETQAARHWRHALARTLADDSVATKSMQSAIWLVASCVRAADTCFRLGGGSAVYAASPLQRRMRDLHTAAQHAIVQQRNYVSGGKLVLESLDMTKKKAG